MGEIAAITVSFCWAVTSIFLTAAGKNLGSMVVNRIRLVFAVILLTITHFFVQGQIFPFDATPHQLLWLGLSGIVGLVVGDGFLIRSYIMIGFRIGTLIMSSVPVISTLFAWFLLGEKVRFFELAGIFLVMSGIMIVVSERNNDEKNQKDRKQYATGILFAFLGAFGQAFGLVLAKKGLEGNFSPLSGVLVRMLSAMVFMWLITLFMGQVKSTIQKSLSSPVALRNIAVGSFVGPFIGVWLSLVAIQNAQVGIASTLMALAPIITLPIMKWGYKEKVSRLAITGTITALCGVAVIFMIPV